MKRLLQLTLFVLSAAASLHAQTSDEAIVRQFFPPSLVRAGAPQMDAFARADLDGIGVQNYIVAVYGNGGRGMVRVIRTTPAPAQVVEETSFNLMAGDVPFVQLADLDGDGRPEVLAAFAVMGGQISWPLKWTGGHLVLIGPSDVGPDRGVRSLLNFVQPLDIDGDGKLELIEWRQDEPIHAVFKLGGDGKFAAQPVPVLYAARYVRHEGATDICTALLPAPAGAKLTITVLNGDAAGGNEVTSGELYFNGTQLLFPNDFKKATRKFTLVATGSPDGTNEIEVDLDGKPGTAVTVSVSQQQ